MGVGMVVVACSTSAIAPQPMLPYPLPGGQREGKVTGLLGEVLLKVATQSTTTTTAITNRCSVGGGGVVKARGGCGHKAVHAFLHGCHLLMQKLLLLLWGFTPLV